MVRCWRKQVSAVPEQKDFIYGQPIIISDMIEKQIPATEKVAKLRSMGFIVEEHRVEKCHGEECFHVWEWQLKTGDDTWINALSLFDDIIRDKMSSLVLDSITRFDVYYKLNRK